MAYATTYDGGFSRSMSRRPSMGYAVSAPAAYNHGGYVEPAMDVSPQLTNDRRIPAHGRPFNSQYTTASYGPIYAPQPSTAVVPLSRRLTGPCELDLYLSTFLETL